MRIRGCKIMSCVLFAVGRRPLTTMEMPNTPVALICDATLVQMYQETWNIEMTRGTIIFLGVRDCSRSFLDPCRDTENSPGMTEQVPGIRRPRGAVQ